MRERLKRWVPVLISAVVSPMHAWFAWSGYRELFVREEGVYVPRVDLTEVTYSTKVTFYLDTPTVTHFLIMLGGVSALLAVVMLAYHTVRRSERSRLVVWTVVEGVAFMLAFVSSVVAVLDFFSTAGQFG